jgi:hypothetical protein
VPTPGQELYRFLSAKILSAKILSAKILSAKILSAKSLAPSQKKKVRIDPIVTTIVVQ